MYVHDGTAQKHFHKDFCNMASQLKHPQLQSQHKTNQFKTQDDLVIGDF